MRHLPQPPTIEDTREWVRRCVDACLQAEADPRLNEGERAILQQSYIEATALKIVNGKRPTWPGEHL